MNKKAVRTGLFLLILTAAAVFSWYSGTPQRRRYSARGLHAALPKFRTEDVAKITVSWRNDRTTMVLKNGRWVLVERGDRPASVPRISQLLNSLASLAPVKELQNPSGETLRELHLADNDPKQVPGVRVELADASGKVLFSMLLREFQLEEASFCSIFTGIDNHAQKIYLRAGLRPVRTFAVMHKTL